MVFKPFKPPLIRKQPPNEANNVDKTSAPQPPSAKRRRVSDDDATTGEDEGVISGSKVENGARIVRQSMARKPLVQVKNSVVETEAEPDVSRTGDKEKSNAEEGEEEYFNVLWFVSRVILSFYLRKTVLCVVVSSF